MDFMQAFGRISYDIEQISRFLSHGTVVLELLVVVLNEAPEQHENQYIFQ